MTLYPGGTRLILRGDQILAPVQSLIGAVDCQLFAKLVIHFPDNNTSGTASFALFAEACLNSTRRLRLIYIITCFRSESSRSGKGALTPAAVCAGLRPTPPPAPS